MKQAPGAKRSDATRGDLLAAFTKLLFAKGLDQVAVQQIAASAGHARSTFYEHFSSKEDVLRASMSRFFAVIADCLVSEEPPELLSKVLEHLWQNRRLSDAIFSGQARVVLARNQIDLVESRLRSIEPTRGLNLPPRLAAAQIAEGQLALLENWMRGRAFCSIENLAAGLHRSSRASALAFMQD